MTDNEFGEVQAISTYLQTGEAPTYQSIDLIIDRGRLIEGYIARTGELMASAKRALNDTKRRTYESVNFSMMAGGVKIPSPLILKDYVASKCSEAEHKYDLAERTNRAATHSLDFLRSALSALKEEAKATTFQNSYKN